jgi:hypothetical protein
MRYALLLSLLSLVSGCTIVPVADAGPCVAVSNARGCQDKPYVIVRSGSETTAQGDSSQKAGTAR